MAWDWGALREEAALEARRLTHDEHSADDAAQEAMIRAWRQRESCRSPEAPGPWLRQIARNEALRLQDWARAHPEQTCDGEILEGGLGSEGPEKSLVRRLCVAQALSELTEEDLRLVRLRYELDLPHVVIARTLGIAESTARVRLHRIRKRLRHQMEGLE